MTGFDHRSAGTPESGWQASGCLDGVAAPAVPSVGDRVVVVAAHPDDETLGAGGLMAICAEAGVEVLVIVATDGEASHPSSSTAPQELGRRRRAEVQAAMELLAADADVLFLGLPDGGLFEHGSGLARQLRPLLGDATHVVTPWRLDRHPDHETCAAVAAELTRETGARHWQYPIWAWHWDDPANPVLPRGSLRRLELSDRALELKRQALACHRSQHTPLSPAPGDEAILPPAIVEHFLRDFETFVLDSTPAASSPAFFDDLYADSDDPWDLQGRFYESRKRELLIASLPRRRFRRAFEPGCSIGLLTELLAPRCEELIAWDVSRRALALAARRTQALPQVRLDRKEIPHDWPIGKLDLIVLSEVGYYAADLTQLAGRVDASLSPDGIVIACHWRHPAPDHPHTAEAVHEVLSTRFETLTNHVEKDFVLQVWSREGRSVAQEEGIVS